MCDRHGTLLDYDNEREMEAFHDFEEEKRGWFESGKVYQEPREALKAGIINQEEYLEIIENQERKWGER